MLDKDKARQIALEFANRVSKVYEPKSIILFGSYVGGNPHEFSDIDVAVVFDAFEGDWLAVWTNLVGIACDVDVLAGIEPHMMDETSDRSGFLAHVKKTGEVIYERRI